MGAAQMRQTIRCEFSIERVIDSIPEIIPVDAQVVPKVKTYVKDHYFRGNVELTLAEVILALGLTYYPNKTKLGLFKTEDLEDPSRLLARRVTLAGGGEGYEPCYFLRYVAVELY